jgi:tripartite-type tricarboxylate transporter receptor subunit TctC
METRLESNRRRRMCLFLVSIMGLGLWFGPGAAESQEAKFPTKAVELVVPWAPGGSMDLVSRVMAEYLPQELKVQVVVKNQAGAGGMTGTGAYLRAKPDGYSIVTGNASSLVSSIQLTRNPPYDPKKDLLPLGYIGEVSYVISVPKSSPFNSIDEFVQYARSNPGKIKGGFSMVGSEAHFGFLSIIRDAKIDVKQVVFTGAAETTSALLGGHVDWVMKSVPTSMPQIRSGDAKALLQTRKTPDLPNVPTGVEKGFPNFNINMWAALFVNSKTPKPVYDRLASAVEATVKKPEVAKKLENIGFIVEYKNPGECSAFIEKERSATALMIKEAGMKVN